MRLEEIDEPLCKEGQTKIKPAFTGICGTGMSLTPFPVLITTSKNSNVHSTFWKMNYASEMFSNVRILVRQIAISHNSFLLFNLLYAIKSYPDFFHSYHA